MSVEENKAIVRRFSEIMNRKELGSFYEVVSTDCVIHGAIDIPAEQYRQFMKTFVEPIIPDLHTTITDIIAEGDKVAVRITWGGTHRGELRGVAATGNKIEMTQNVFNKITDDKIVEIWSEQNERRLMQQLGALPEGGK